MTNISEPYIIHYPRIVALADESGSQIELIEFFDCIGGAMWSQQQYAKSPLVKNVRCIGHDYEVYVNPWQCGSCS